MTGLLDEKKNQSFTSEWVYGLAHALHEEFEILNKQSGPKLAITFSDTTGLEEEHKSDPTVASGFMMTQMIMAMMRVADRGYKLPPVYMCD